MELYRWLRPALWLLAVALGAGQAWTSRHAMFPDGISYLEIGEAFWRGDWRNAVNGYWSPLYAWILGFALVALRPSAYWEFAVVHLSNFLIYVGALACFDFFLHEWIGYLCVGGQARRAAVTILPAWAWAAFGYLLFMWSSLHLITLGTVTPDLLVAAFTYLSAALVFRIGRTLPERSTYAFLGLTLALGYLTKAPMFVVAFAWLGVVMLVSGDLRRSLRGVATAAAVFGLVSAPYIVWLSMLKGRPTLGDSARLNYAYHVNHVGYLHWWGLPKGSGTPKHPPKQMFIDPPVYEFGSRPGTYPPWFDPSYWNEGISARFDLRAQLNTLSENLETIRHIFLSGRPLFIGAVLLAIWTVGRERWKQTVARLGRAWPLLIPSGGAVIMFALVHVEFRYVAPFFVLLSCALVAVIPPPAGSGLNRLVSLLPAAAVALMIVSTAPSFFTLEAASARTRGDRVDMSRHLQWEVAQGLNRLGVKPGAGVGVIGSSIHAYWARLARVKIVAETPASNIERFWRADAKVRSKVIRAFAGAGVEVVVTRAVSRELLRQGWQEIGKTRHSAQLLRP